MVIKMNTMLMASIYIGGSNPVPPAGYVFLIDSDGYYLIDSDGYFLIEKI